MKFTLSWLKDHLDTDADLNTIGETLTNIGLELEEVLDPAAALAPFTVGFVKSCEQHPNADRLKVCVVDTGKEEVQVVCGAPNARAGMKGVFAPAGSYIPGTGIDLKSAKVRGVESNGMLCSEKEMGLSEDHTGIIELPDDAPVGEPFARVAGLDDPVIEIAITPNRQDALGVHGIARDLAAAKLGTLKPLDTTSVTGRFESPVKWKRDLPKGKEDACPFVVGRYFKGVKNGPSPKWLQERLKAIGLRPISALVDITNLVTYDLARPLHVFDADKVKGDLTMRMAKAGEKILALDGREYALDPEITVIADAERVHGIGGIMGGEESGCTEETTNVFLEVALFDPTRTAASGRRLNILSDARYRFERGVDPESALWGAEVAARLILELCGGEASEIVSAGEMPDYAFDVTFRPARLDSLGGMHVPEEEIERILSAQGFEIKGKGERWTVGVPSWRIFDVHGEADLVEDILRVYGYDHIPSVSLRTEGAMPPVVVTPEQRRIRLARRALAARGMLEAVTWSFMDARLAPLFGGGKDDMKLANPISADLDEMRPSVLPNLIQAAGRNADKGYPDAALFEVGPQYATTEPDGQATVAAGVRAGNAGPRHWDTKPRPVDAYDAKADALAALNAAGAPTANLQTTTDAPDWYHPGRSGVLRLGKNVLAVFGEVHPRVLRRLDVKGPMAVFEVFLDNLPPVKSKDSKTRPMLRPSPFQPVERDFAFLVDAATPAETLVRAAAGADKQLVTDVVIFDVYAGKGIPEGKKSVAFAVTLQPTEKTLTDEEIDAVAQKIIANVVKQTGGELRG